MVAYRDEVAEVARWFGVLNRYTGASRDGSGVRSRGGGRWTI